MDTNSYNDVKIRCQDCGDTFIFTAQEQKFYESKDFVPPRRCKKCRIKRKEI